MWRPRRPVSRVLARLGLHHIKMLPQMEGKLTKCERQPERERERERLGSGLGLYIVTVRKLM